VQAADKPSPFAMYRFALLAIKPGRLAVMTDKPPSFPPAHDVDTTPFPSPPSPLPRPVLVHWNPGHNSHGPSFATIQTEHSNVDSFTKISDHLAKYLKTSTDLATMCIRAHFKSKRICSSEREIIFIDHIFPVPISNTEKNRLVFLFCVWSSGKIGFSLTHLLDIFHRLIFC
jgi:hypothetical protein